MKTKGSISHAFCGALALFVVLQGCGDDDNDNPQPPDDVTPIAGTKSTGGSGGKSNASDGGDTNSTAGTGKGGSNNTGGTGKGGSESGAGAGNDGQGGEPEVGGAGAGPGPQPQCDLPELGADGCFNCPVDGEVEQWLNRCVDSDCEPFDNAARLPLLESDGSLPDLPN
jgi:hypothetical protein